MSSSEPQPVAAEVPLDAVVVDAPPAHRGSFTLIATIAILAGIGGLLGVCFAGGLAVMTATTPAAAPLPAGASALDRFQYDLRTEWQGITELYFPGLVGFSLWHVLVLVALLAGGIRLLKRTQAGRVFMIYALLFVLLFEVLRTGMYLMMMLEMMPLVDTSFQRAMQQAGPANSQMAVILRRMATGITVVAILIALVWPAIKLLFYGWAAKYLASPEALELCTPAPFVSSSTSASGSVQRSGQE